MTLILIRCLIEHIFIHCKMELKFIHYNMELILIHCKQVIYKCFYKGHKENKNTITSIFNKKFNLDNSKSF